MSGARPRTTGLRFAPRPLAPPGSLAAELATGRGSIRVPLASDLDAPPAPRASVLGADTFGTSGTDTASKLERVLSGEGLVVTTGHQPILFLGPLYVLYKALTAIEVARQLEARWRVPVVPVFWIASDDHDWDEVAGTTLLDGEQPIRLHVEPPHGWKGRPVGPSPLEDSISERIAQLTQLLPASEFTPRYIDDIRAHYQPSASHAEAFAGLLRAVLGDRGYAWLDASRPETKRAAAEWFLDMLRDPGPYLRSARAGAERLRAANREPPIPILDGALPVFFDTGKRRERLYAREEGVSAGRRAATETTEAWIARLRAEPEAFSPNVSSRPVLESRLLPVAATVLGPGEIAYWGQLAETFEAASTPFPAIQPRAAWTVVEPRVQKLLDRFGLAPEDLSDGGEGASTSILRTGRSEEVDASLGELRHAITGALDKVERSVGDALPGIKGTVGKARKGLYDSVQELARGIDRETRQRLDTQLGQIRRCAANLFPEHRPQERVLNPFHFLARYGPDFVDELEGATREAVGASLAAPEADG